MWEIYVIVVFCLGGVSYTAWKIGVSTGVSQTLAYLEEEGIITFEEDE